MFSKSENMTCFISIAIQVFEDNEVEQQPAAKRGPKPKSLKEKEAKRKEKEVLHYISFCLRQELFA